MWILQWYSWVLLVGVLIFLQRTLRRHRQAKSVAILVLGDLGRSPRMQYHALSLASRFLDVQLIGYSGSLPMEEIRKHPRITIHLISPPPFQNAPRRLFVLIAPLKLLFQVLQIFRIFFFLPGPTHMILVQNPPSLPTLLVARVISWFEASYLVIDWHNFGFSLLALKLGERHLFVRISKWYERVIGAMADEHICVTHAMAKWMEKKWNIRPHVLHDCPAAVFRPTPPPLAHSLFERIEEEELSSSMTDLTRILTDYSAGEEGKTIVTERNENGNICHRSRRPALVISPTSWTPDEDMVLAMDAIQIYDKEAEKNPSLPPLVFFITGKGPQKEMGEQIMAGMNQHLSKCVIISAFFKAEDYPKVLGCCDIGISMHTSSSGLDLPMKVVDMFGCGVMTCAKNFECIEELVQEGKNGLVFDTAPQLASQLVSLLQGFPIQGGQLSLLRNGALKSGERRWDDEWNEKCRWLIDLIASSHIKLSPIDVLIPLFLALWTFFWSWGHGSDIASN